VNSCCRSYASSSSDWHSFLHHLRPGAFVTMQARLPAKPRQRRFPKWEQQKINPEAVENFSGPKKDREPTTIHHTSTTNSPAKNHIQTAHFHKNPCKNAQNHPNIKILFRMDHTRRIQFHSPQVRDPNSPGVVAHNRSPAPMRQQFQAQPRLRATTPGELGSRTCGE